MNKLYTIMIALLLHFNYSTGQINVFGTTQYGGNYGTGAIYTANGLMQNSHILFSFPAENPGSQPSGNLLLAPNGIYYGVSRSGGNCNAGLIFQFDQASNSYTVLANFDPVLNGRKPAENLTIGPNGNLYGVCEAGGSDDYGTIFEFDTISRSITLLHQFTIDSLGGAPMGALTLLNGKFYGMTAYGGIHEKGTLFEFDPLTNIYLKKVDLELISLGQYPYSGLVAASNGKLYGMTNEGGITIQGALIEYDPVADTCIKRHDFESSTGSHPWGRLISLPNGKLYGTAQEGGSINSSGVLFEFETSTLTYTVIHNFGSSAGHYPLPYLTFSNGRIYGMTDGGGANSNGTIWSVDTSSFSLTVEYDFPAGAGLHQYGELAVGSNGTFYGFAVQNSGLLSLFSYNVNSQVAVNLIDFELTPDGGYPSGGVTLANSKLYGLTSHGGVNNLGVLYDFDPATGNYNKVVDFDGTSNGSKASGTLLLATNNFLYGTTTNGGNNNEGIFFSLDPSTNVFTKIIDFNSTSTGAIPNGSPIQAANGKIYGTTNQGGVNNKGVIYEYDIISNTLNPVFDFNTATGELPLAGLLKAQNGLLYGTTTAGGDSSSGVLFQFDPNTNTYTLLENFHNFSTGRAPATVLTEGVNNKLYGTCRLSAPGGYGTFYEFDPLTNTLTTIQSFDAFITGYEPTGTFSLPDSSIWFYNRRVGIDFSKSVKIKYDINTSTLSAPVVMNCDYGVTPVVDAPLVINSIINSNVWPGDCNFDLVVNNLDYLYNGLAYNSTGPVRPSASVNWIGQPSAPWMAGFQSGLNYKHVDANGNGTIDSLDAEVTTLNYGLSHPLRLAETNLITLGELTLIPLQQVVVPGDTAEYIIQLADGLSPLPEIYGVAFSVSFDTGLTDTSFIELSYSPSVLGTLGTDMRSYYHSNYALGIKNAAVCRTDQINLTNIFGTLGLLRIKISSSISSPTIFPVTLNGIKCITKDDSLFTLYSTPSTISIDPAVKRNDVATEHRITMYPLPSMNEVYIHTENSSIHTVMIHSTTGSLIKLFHVSGKLIQLNLEDLLPGIYVTSILTERGTVKKLLSIVK